MKKRKTFTRDVTKLSRGEYQTLGISIPAKDVQEMGLEKGSRVLVTIEKI